MDKLTSKVCEPCNSLTPHLTPDQITELSKQIPGWEIQKKQRIFKRWEFKNFADSLEFVNQVGALAEAENHHPDINFGWGYVELTIWTHAIHGLSKNDFILATKVNTIRKIQKK